MAAKIVDLIIEQGADFSGKMTFYNTDGTRRDISTDEFAGQIRAFAYSDAILASFTFEKADQEDPETKGDAYFNLSAEVTAAISVPPVKGQTRPVGNYVYDIQWMLETGEIIRTIQGAASVSSSVTREIEE